MGNAGFISSAVVPVGGTPRLSASPGITRGNLIIVDVVLLF